VGWREQRGRDEGKESSRAELTFVVSFDVDRASEILANEPNLLEVDAPITGELAFPTTTPYRFARS